MIAEQDLDFEVDGLLLSGGAFAADPARGLVVLLHGIPSIAPPDPDDAGYPGLARRLAESGWTAAWVNMRGAKGSPGFFSIEGWVRDASAAVAAVRARFDDGPLALVGSSAGGSVATEAVARGTSVEALALLAAPATWVSFASEAAAAVQRITVESGMALAEDVLADPAAWAGEFESVVTEEAIEKVEVPVLIVHGSSDVVVPVEHAKRIAERASGARLEIIEGGAHQLRRDERAVTVLEEWLEKTLG